MKLLQERSVNKISRYFSGSLGQKIGYNNSHDITDTFSSVAQQIRDFSGLFVHRRRFISHFNVFKLLLL